MKMLNNITITDATAGIGGNTISFCKFFKNVYGIEINDTRFNFLKNNLKIYELNNANLINDNMLNVIDKLKQDVIFVDPPWGGKDYIKHKSLDLFIDNKEISLIMKNALDKGFCKLAVLKLPFNYNLNNIEMFDSKKYNFTKYLIRKKILLILINKI